MFGREFGPIAFETRKGKALPQGGFAKPREFALLNEQQATPLTTYMKNTEIVRGFEKKHGHVLRDIETLDCSEEFDGLNFGPISYKDSMNRSKPAYNLTRDGFTFLAMGFTGKGQCLQPSVAFQLRGKSDTRIRQSPACSHFKRDQEQGSDLKSDPAKNSW